MIADRIRKIRISKGISQDAVAYGLGITQPAYSKTENAKTKFDFVRIQEIAEILGCTTAKIITFGDNDSILKSIADLQEKVIELEKKILIEQKSIEELQNRK